MSARRQNFIDFRQEPNDSSMKHEEPLIENISMSLGKLKVLQAENETGEKKLYDEKNKWDEQVSALIVKRERELFAANRNVREIKSETAEILARSLWSKQEAQRIQQDIHFVEEGIQVKERTLENLKEKIKELEEHLRPISQMYEERRDELELVKNHLRDHVN
ncbi:hypothetical protein ACOME3_006084 [Neoechinorhynchus agilis]